jgi:predicted nuclease of predicted toxin-antitoxin system
MIIIDENVDQVLIDKLDTKNFDTFLIRDHHPGASDREIIAIAKSNKGLIITEDKDFGELVFSHGIGGLSIILLRYNKSDYNDITKNLMKVLADYYDRHDPYFITVTRKKIRIRKL